ncbi:hypothetical protein D3C72_2387220 [compost metagenome]
MEGDRQQHGDGCRCADARKDPDQGAEKHADEAEEQVGGGTGGYKAEREIVEKFHCASPRIGPRGRSAGRAGRDRN